MLQNRHRVRRVAARRDGVAHEGEQRLTRRQTSRSPPGTGTVRGHENEAYLQRGTSDLRAQCRSRHSPDEARVVTNTQRTREWMDGAVAIENGKLIRVVRR